jgi:predicted glutamine amidotransferase
MCRLLFVKSEQPFLIRDYLQPFAEISKNSKEYQGHGWGCFYLDNDGWKHYKNIKPVWEDNPVQFGQTKLLIAHARSAFRDRDIRVENNMPFYNGKLVYIFNGELHGVKIREAGRIGAEKIFNFILRFYNGEVLSAMQRAIPIIRKRSQYIRAMNIIITDGKSVSISTEFNEDFKYFTMHYKRTGETLAICSDPFPGETDWKPIKNKTIRKF